jgi:hypothetical protein
MPVVKSKYMLSTIFSNRSMAKSDGGVKLQIMAEFAANYKIRIGLLRCLA